MLKVLLVAINGRFVHTSLSVRTLKEYAKRRCEGEIASVEFTLNTPADQILEELYLQKPALLCFSCYIWNIDLVLELCRDYRLIAPWVKIALGGPEVSFESDNILADNPQVDYILYGEGEESFTRLVGATDAQLPLTEVPGLVYREGGQILTTRPPKPIDLGSLFFPYTDWDVQPGQIVYYESSRGCPFNCQYCVSSIERGMRHKKLEQVQVELAIFLARRAQHVKFVDRTFNADRDFACGVWEYLIEKDNGLTHFHFEIAGDLLDDRSLQLLRRARRGLFQFEIGVQSTNPRTLRTIGRSVNLEEVFYRTEQLRALGNIHIHLDLIAGLPYEDIASFEESFNTLFALRPHVLQLDFLKLLRGTELHQRAQSYGLIYRRRAPYQVISTPWLPFEDILRLGSVENMVDLYFNSGRFSRTLAFMLARVPSPFQFFLRLGEYYKGMGHRIQSQSREAQFTILRNFWCITNSCSPILALLCRLDIMLHERPRKFPEWAERTTTPEEREQILGMLSDAFIARSLPQYEGMDAKQLLRTIYAEVFPVDLEETPFRHAPTLYIFDYQRRDVDGHARLLRFPMDF